MFSPLLTIAFLIPLGCFASGCAQIKEAGRTIGHTTRDVTREIGHGARDVTREIGHGTREVVSEMGAGTPDSANADQEKSKKGVKPANKTTEY
jgi:hypothetical protein